MADWNAETDEVEGDAGEDWAYNAPGKFVCEICPNNPEMGKVEAIFR